MILFKQGRKDNLALDNDNQQRILSINSLHYHIALSYLDAVSLPMTPKVILSMFYVFLFLIMNQTGAYTGN